MTLQCVYCSGDEDEIVKKGKPGECYPICNRHFKKFQRDRMPVVVNYEKLQDVLDLAFRRAAIHKGHQRHGSDEKFEDQQVFKILGLVEGPLGSLDYQIIKKTLESTRLSHRTSGELNVTAPIGEMLDVIVYAAIKILELRNV